MVRDPQGVSRLLGAVDSCDSLAEAAVRLGISLPTLTERMRELESALPCSPFATAGRRKVLSEFGRRILDATRPLALALNAAFDDAIAMETHPSQAVVRLAGRAEILSLLARKCQLPGTLVLEPCGSAEASRKVRDFECDFAVSHLPPAHASLVSRKLFSSDYALHIPDVFFQGSLSLSAFVADERLPPVGHAAWRTLTKLPCLSYSAEHPSLGVLGERSGLEAGDLRFSVLCRDWDVIADLVARGRGFAVLPDRLLDPPHGTRHWELGRGGGHRKTFAVHYRKETTRRPAGRALLGLLLDALR